MDCEGHGRKPPARKLIRLSRGDLLAIFQASEIRAGFREYAKRKDVWGKGLGPALHLKGIGTVLKSVRPIFVGLIGEYVVAREFNQPLDLALRKHGDGGVDLRPNGLPIQVKTCEGGTCCNLLRVVDGRGNKLSHAARALVFCNWLPTEQVCIRGWMWMKDALARPAVPAYVGDHLNVEVPDDVLLPMSRLKDHVEAREGLLDGAN